jgi:hypothetical protein
VKGQKHFEKKNTSGLPVAKSTFGLPAVKNDSGPFVAKKKILALRQNTKSPRQENRWSNRI